MLCAFVKHGLRRKSGPNSADFHCRPLNDSEGSLACANIYIHTFMVLMMFGASGPIICAGTGDRVLMLAGPNLHLMSPVSLYLLVVLVQ